MLSSMLYKNLTTQIPGGGHRLSRSEDSTIGRAEVSFHAPRGTLICEDGPEVQLRTYRQAHCFILYCP